MPMNDISKRILIVRPICPFLVLEVLLSMVPSRKMVLTSKSVAESILESVSRELADVSAAAIFSAVSSLVTRV